MKSSSSSSSLNLHIHTQRVSFVKMGKKRFYFNFFLVSILSKSSQRDVDDTKLRMHSKILLRSRSFFIFFSSCSSSSNKVQNAFTEKANFSSSSTRGQRTSRENFFTISSVLLPLTSSDRYTHAQAQFLI